MPGEACDPTSKPLRLKNRKSVGGHKMEWQKERPERKMRTLRRSSRSENRKRERKYNVLPYIVELLQLVARTKPVISRK